MTPIEPAGDKNASLYLLPVPIGDGDPTSVLPSTDIITARRIKHFIVENERSARRFLKKCDKNIDIDSLTFFVLDEHTDPSQVESMLAPLAEGHDMAVVSEAGCPAVADPGSLAVAIAHRKGYRVVPLVGPSSILLSLMASGFNGQSFAFNGYLPVDSSKRTAKLKEMTRRIEKERQTQIFIETPYRNNRLIAELCKTLPQSMKLCVASALTTPAEKIVVKTIRDWSKTPVNLDKVPAIFLLFTD